MMGFGGIHATCTWQPDTRRIDIEYHPPRREWIDLAKPEVIEARIHTTLDSFSFRVLLLDYDGNEFEGQTPSYVVTIGQIEHALNRTLDAMERDGWIAAEFSKPPSTESHPASP